MPRRLGQADKHMCIRQESGDTVGVCMRGVLKKIMCTWRKHMRWWCCDFVSKMKEKGECIFRGN